MNMRAILLMAVPHTRPPGKTCLPGCRGPVTGSMEYDRVPNDNCRPTSRDVHLERA
jgi:hypothetical protein